MDTFFLLEISSSSNSSSDPYTAGPYAERNHAIHAAMLLREIFMGIPGRYKTVLNIVLKEVIFKLDGPPVEIQQELLEIINKD